MVMDTPVGTTLFGPLNSMLMLYPPSTLHWA